MQKIRGFLVAALFGLTLAGCRDTEVQPRYNRNLGTADVPLMPGRSVVLDGSLRVSGSGQAMELPALPDTLPPIDEVERPRGGANGPGAPGTGIEAARRPDAPAPEPEPSGIDPGE